MSMDVEDIDARLANLDCLIQTAFELLSDKDRSDEDSEKGFGLLNCAEREIATLRGEIIERGAA